MSFQKTTKTSARKAHWLNVALQEVRKSSSVNLQFEKRFSCSLSFTKYND